MAKYNHQEIEQKWQAYWEDRRIFAALDGGKSKFYCLDMFAYPSGEGLHVGHPRGYTASDVYAKYQKLKGMNVLHPFGWDAFGLPTENYALKVGMSPREATDKNVINFKRQLKSFGFGYDWDREIDTSRPEFYKWTQWLFKTLFDNGYAYQKEGYVNWCPKDQTVLANEQVVNGCCERCGTQIEQKRLKQWFFKITDFAEELLDGLDKIDWPISTKEGQRNWIGKSEGAEIKFQTDRGEVVVFTTRPDTLFGATFLVVSPELGRTWIADGWAPENKVTEYIDKALAKLERDRLEGAGEKSGVDSGIMATHPTTGEKIPVWIADYVVGSYGTGAIMAVPAHDKRDFDFATKFGLPIKEVIEPLITVTEGVDAIKDGVAFEHRNAVVCLIKHWSEDKYLCQQWKKTNWRGFVVGGVEAGEDVVEAGAREIVEETGYQHPKFVQKLGGIVNARFYHNVKKVNRWGHFTGLVYQLEDDSHMPVVEAEDALHEMKWIDASEVADFVTAQDMKLFWRRAQGEVVFAGEGLLNSSGEFDGMTSAEATEAIVTKIGASKKTTYRLRDWSVARQRYWGSPIPVVYDAEGVAHSVEEKDLPVVLPTDADIKPSGVAPLSTSKTFNDGVEAKYGAGAHREVETLDTFVCSSWYYLRYCDPNNMERFASKESLKAWMPVDMYVGGAEHTNGHLLYARFITKVLHRLGYLDFDEPFLRLRHQGFILGENGEKMSKSRGNVVNPDEVVAQYGADVLRIFELFVGPFDQSTPWDTKGVIGVRRFLEKLHRLVERDAQTQGELNQPSLHRLVKKVTEDLEEFRFNTMVAAVMEYLNGLGESEGSGWTEVVVRLIAPVAPHLAEEMWQGVMGKTGSVFEAAWPEYDAKLIVKTSVTIAVQEKGKLRGTVTVAAGSDEASVMAEIGANAKLKSLSESYSKHIFVADKIVNFV